MQTLNSKNNQKQVLLRGISPTQCVISRYNTRKVRNKEDIDKLAERMKQNGYELTRALWAYENGQGVYEVFAGGTRLEAAKKADIDVDIILHEGFSWEEISRLSDQDNENDEYHTPVRPADVWAEYARLKDIEGWTQKQIAKAKGVTESRVSERLQYHELPLSIRDMVGNSSSVLTEYHLAAVFGKVPVLELLQSWADIDTWRVNALTWAHDKKKSSRQLSEHWEQYIDAVNRANELIQTLSEQDVDFYTLENNEIKKATINWQKTFVEGLIKEDAISLAEVDYVFSRISKGISTSEQYRKALQDKLDKESIKQQQEQEKIEFIQDRWILGDSLNHISNLEDGSVSLLLTDPSYGIDFQSNRRTKSGKEDKLANDTLQDALDTMDDMLRGIHPKMKEDSHILLFTHWRTECLVRQLLKKNGYILRGSLIWVKENHTSGNLEGAFAPRHERILHAVKGNPKISPRIDDVLHAKRGTETTHPTEKPVDLLESLIKSTTQLNDLVVDPFAGSGSTVVAAHKLSRNWWGCEISEEWWNAGYKRLKDEQLSR